MGRHCKLPPTSNRPTSPGVVPTIVVGPEMVSPLPPISQASKLSTNTLRSFRCSSRLASKKNGINKSSLQIAQDLMCSKLKTVKSSYRRLCTSVPTEPSSLIPPSDDLLEASPHEQLKDAEPISDLLPSPRALHMA